MGKPNIVVKNAYKYMGMRIKNLKIPKQLQENYKDCFNFIQNEFNTAIKLGKSLQVLVGEKHSGIAEVIAKCLVAIAGANVGLDNFNMEISKEIFDEVRDKDNFFKLLERMIENSKGLSIDLVNEYNANDLDKVFSYLKDQSQEIEGFYELLNEFYNTRNVNMVKNSDLKLNNIFFIGLEHVKGINETLLNKNCHTTCINVSEIFTINSFIEYLPEISQEFSEDYSREITLDLNLAPGTAEYLRDRKFWDLKLNLSKEIIEHQYDGFLLNKLFFYENNSIEIENIGNSIDLSE